MKKLLLLLLFVPLIFSCGNDETNYKLANDDQSNIEDETTEQEIVLNEDTLIEKKGFSVSEEFFEADDETFLSLLVEAALILNISEEERIELITRLKQSTQVYLRENSYLTEENIIINEAEIGPSQRLLDALISQWESYEAELYMNIDYEGKLLDSGFGKYKDKFDYIFINSFGIFDGNKRYSLQYIISVNNKNFHLIINTKEGLDINDVFIDIN